LPRATAWSCASLGGSGTQVKNVLASLGPWPAKAAFSLLLSPLMVYSVSAVASLSCFSENPGAAKPSKPFSGSRICHLFYFLYSQRSTANILQSPLGRDATVGSEE